MRALTEGKKKTACACACAVQPKLIAMSVPAIGFTAFYRNPLTEVVRFFESRHAPATGGYLVVNCCPELPYPQSVFYIGPGATLQREATPEAATNLLRSVDGKKD